MQNNSNKETKLRTEWIGKGRKVEGKLNDPHQTTPIKRNQLIFIEIREKKRKRKKKKGKIRQKFEL